MELLASAAAADADGNGGAGGDGDTDWHAISRARKKKAGLFVCVHDLGERLVTACIVLKAFMVLLNEGLYLSSTAFDEHQALKAKQGGALTYRVLETARGAVTRKAFDASIEVLYTVPWALPKQFWTMRARSMIFRMCSTFLCCVESLLSRHHRIFPYALFRILDGPAEASAVYSMDECLWDELASEFFRLYPTVTEGTSEPAQILLLALAQLVDVDPCIH